MSNWFAKAAPLRVALLPVEACHTLDLFGFVVPEMCGKGHSRG